MSVIGPGVSSASRESFSISVVSRAEFSGSAPWTSTFADQRKDHRYYEILDDTLRGCFDHRYFAIVDSRGRTRAIQPFFLVDQDILEGLGADRIYLISLIRRFYPRFLKLRALMVGCSAGEAHLAATETLPADIVAETLSNGIVEPSAIAQCATHRAEGISFSLSQYPLPLRATGLRARAKHADDDARYPI